MSTLEVRGVVEGSGYSEVLRQLDGWIGRPFTGTRRRQSTDKPGRLKGESTCLQGVLCADKKMESEKERGLGNMRGDCESQ